MIELLLFNLHFVLLFPRFDVFSYSSKSFLLVKRFLAHCFNCHFKLTYFLVFEITFTVSFIEISNKRPEFLLLSFDIDVVGLKVFIFLPAENYVELIVQASDCLIDIVLGPFKLVPPF